MLDGFFNKAGVKGFKQRKLQADIDEGCRLPK
jgi:hypothetical protein